MNQDQRDVLTAFAFALALAVPTAGTVVAGAALWPPYGAYLGGAAALLTYLAATLAWLGGR